MEVKEYPYFVYPLIEQLKETADEDRLKKTRERLAANIGNEPALRNLLCDGYDMMQDFYPDLQTVHTDTDSTIDTFIEKFGGNTSADTEQLLPDTSAPSDYFAAIAFEESLETKPEEPAAEESETEDGNPTADGEEKTPDDTPLTYEFAKMLLRDGNYSKALEIIHSIYLNNPEKSIYFADQIRFIKKLMLNEEKKKLKY